MCIGIFLLDSDCPNTTVSVCMEKEIRQCCNMCAQAVSPVSELLQKSRSVSSKLAELPVQRCTRSNFKSQYRLRLLLTRCISYRLSNTTSLREEVFVYHSKQDNLLLMQRVLFLICRRQIK